jgi:hypothetical protein
MPSVGKMTLLGQSCFSDVASEFRRGQSLPEVWKQGPKTLSGRRNLVTAGVSSIREPEVFNRRGFQTATHNPSGTHRLDQQICGLKSFSQQFPQA